MRLPSLTATAIAFAIAFATAFATALSIGVMSPAKLMRCKINLCDPQSISHGANISWFNMRGSHGTLVSWCVCLSILRCVCLSILWCTCLMVRLSLCLTVRGSHGARVSMFPGACVSWSGCGIAGVLWCARVIKCVFHGPSAVVHVCHGSGVLWCMCAMVRVS